MTVTESLVSVEWLAARQPGPIVLDATAVLPAPEFDGDYRLGSGLATWREAHIPGSRHADLVGELSDRAAARHFTRLAPHALAARLGEYGIDDETDVVLYDSAGGIWATRLWWQLRAIGLAAAVLDGGLGAWRAAGLPLEQGDGPVPERAAGRSIAVHETEAWAEIDAVAAISTGDAPGTLVCALGRDQFEGTAPTRYTRRGRIPGSVNLPARSLVTPDTGLLASDEELQAAVLPLLEAQGPIVVYCGGGISATLLALGLVRAGRSDVRIYDGSLEEWTADPGRAVE
jgi:thiosulfate/3-mercaptopyruvate sulfurtransferase